MYVYAQSTQIVVSLVNTTDGAVLASTAAIHPVLNKNLTHVAYYQDAIRSQVSKMPKGGGSRSSNDRRSDVMNLNNPEYHASHDNASDLGNPNNDAYRSPRGLPPKQEETEEDDSGKW